MGADNDIVERLEAMARFYDNQAAHSLNHGPNCYAIRAELARDTAAEIVRLRGEVSKWQGLAEAGVTLAEIQRRREQRIAAREPIAPAEAKGECEHSLRYAATGKCTTCGCGEPTCVEPWEPGCGLGTSMEHAVLAPQPAGGEAVARSRSGAVAFLFDFIAEYDEHEESEWSSSWRALAERARELCEKHATELAEREAAYLDGLGDDPRLDGWAPDTTPPAAQVQQEAQRDPSHAWPAVDRVLIDAYNAGTDGAELDLIEARRKIAALQHRGDSRGGEAKS